MKTVLNVGGNNKNIALPVQYHEWKQSDPIDHALQAWNGLYEAYYGQLMAQTHLKPLHEMKNTSQQAANDFKWRKVA